jgi:hypothetical protein
MIGVAHGRLGNVPGSLPGDVMFVEQKTHQFRHGQGWVGVIELDRDVGGELIKASVVCQVAPDDILYGTGHEEIFLD